MLTRSLSKSACLLVHNTLTALCLPPHIFSRLPRSLTLATLRPQVPLLLRRVTYSVLPLRDIKREPPRLACRNLFCDLAPSYLPLSPTQPRLVQPLPDTDLRKLLVGTFLPRRTCDLSTLPNPESRLLVASPSHQERHTDSRHGTLLKVNVQSLLSPIERG